MTQATRLGHSLMGWKCSAHMRGACQPCRDLNLGLSLLITSVRPLRRTICEPCIFFIEPSELRTFILKSFPFGRYNARTRPLFPEGRDRAQGRSDEEKVPVVGL